MPFPRSTDPSAWMTAAAIHHAITLPVHRRSQSRSSRFTAMVYAQRDMAFRSPLAHRFELHGRFDEKAVSGSRVAAPASAEAADAGPGPGCRFLHTSLRRPRICHVGHRLPIVWATLSPLMAWVPSGCFCTVVASRASHPFEYAVRRLPSPAGRR